MGRESSRGLRIGARIVALASLVAVASLSSGCASLSIAQERRLGAQMVTQAQQQLPILRDPVVNDYVANIGRRLVQAAGPQPFDYHFAVLQSEEVNAFAMPAGYIFVNTGLILATRNVSELAGVLAHEVGHVAKRHIAKNYERQKTAGWLREAGVLAASLTAGPAAGGAVNLLGGLSELAVLNSFGRQEEREADAFAVRILPRAGYDPDGIVTLFEMLERAGGPNVPAFLSDHPATADRLATAEKEVSALPAAQRASLEVDDGGKLQIIQRRIELLTGERPPLPEGGSPGPVRGRD